MQIDSHDCRAEWLRLRRRVRVCGEGSTAGRRRVEERAALDHGDARGMEGDARHARHRGDRLGQDLWRRAARSARRRGSSQQSRSAGGGVSHRRRGRTRDSGALAPVPANRHRRRRRRRRTRHDAAIDRALRGDVGWEADLWGRVRSQSASAAAARQATEADLLYARQSVAATIATLWYEHGRHRAPATDGGKRDHGVRRAVDAW